MIPTSIDTPDYICWSNGYLEISVLVSVIEKYEESLNKTGKSFLFNTLLLKRIILSKFQ